MFINRIIKHRIADNRTEWVRPMNACKAQAEEIVKAELIYDWVKKVRAQSRSGFFISHKIRGRLFVEFMLQF